MTVPGQEKKILVQFDGRCVLCSRTVRQIIKADQEKKFVFQSIPETTTNPESITVWRNNISYQHFDAVLVVASELGGFYRLLGIFRILPRSWRKTLYLWVARNRFRWFGKRKTCFIPSPEEKERFI
jgi:Uncharacterized protein conserved in bacteria